MSHSADKVPVGRADRHLILRQNAHMSAQTGAAGRRADNAACIDKDVEQALVHCLLPNCLCSRDHDAANVAVHLMPLQHCRRRTHILDTAVRAGADNRLIHLDLRKLRSGAGIFRQMRAGDRQRNFIKIQLNGADIFSILIRLIRGIPSVAVLLHIFHRARVHRENSVFRTGFDRHITDRKAVVHSQLFNVAAELQRLVQRAVYPDEPDQIENHILAGHIRLFFAGDTHADRFRNLKPCFACGHCAAHIRRTYAGGKRAERTVGAGVRIGADHAITRHNKTLFGKQCMLDANASDFKIIRDLLRMRKLAHLKRLLRALDILIRRKMIGHKRDLMAVEHLFLAQKRELLNGNGRCDIVPQHHIQLAHNQLPRLYLAEPRLGGKQLLRHRHSHSFSSLLCNFTDAAIDRRNVRRDAGFNNIGGNRAAAEQLSVLANHYRNLTERILTLCNRFDVVLLQRNVLIDDPVDRLERSVDRAGSHRFPGKNIPVAL